MNSRSSWRVLGAAVIISVLSRSVATAQSISNAQPITIAPPNMIAPPAATGLRLDLTRSDRYVVRLQVRSYALPTLWADSNAVKRPRYPFMADPRRWPRLFANTTECTLSLNPITRRHWWQG